MAANEITGVTWRKTLRTPFCRSNTGPQPRFGNELKNDIWWLGITAGLSMLDAYVDAHLSDFESEKEKIRLRFSGDALLLQYNF